MSEVPPATGSPAGFPGPGSPVTGSSATDTPADGFPVVDAAPRQAGAAATGGPRPRERGGQGRLAGGARRGPRRRRTRWRAAFFALAGVVIVVGIAWALLGDRLFVVRSVSVTGTHLLEPAQVVAAADVPLGTPLMNVDAGAVTRRVEAIRDVASATVTKDWPDHVVIAVTERVPVMAVRMAGGGYDLVDKTGVIVRFAAAKPAALPLFATTLSGRNLRGDASVTAVTEVLGELPPWLAQQVTQARATPVPAGPAQVTLGLRNGQTIQWGSPGDATQKNRELAILQGSQARVIDVSAPGTVVTR
jgi:cell division protein FtsQ